MPDPAQLAQYIRFAMEQLSEQNAQHAWEHLCRHFARQRICSNILPATGPVQAGGDQGRDFETFTSYIPNIQASSSYFIGLTTEKRIVFACTVEKEISSKLKNDVATILSQGTLVDAICFLCTSDVPVAQRHKLQKWASDTHNMPLDIFDGMAISEELVSPDLFWLATRYLQVPPELTPVYASPEEAEDEYTKALLKWRAHTDPAASHAEFSEIRSAAYAALGPRSYGENGEMIARMERPELPFWIEQLDALARNNNAMPSLRRHAFFEASVMRVKGLDSLLGQEDLLRSFFASCHNVAGVKELDEAQVLLAYVFGAQLRDVADIAFEEWELWCTALERQIRQRISNARESDYVNEQCALLDIGGHLAICQALFTGNNDLTIAFRYWKDLVEIAADAPLFPLERFCETLAQSVGLIGTDDDFESLIEASDRLLADRFGHFKTAEMCMKRAIAFEKAGDLPRAMAQIHRAKVDWFADETLGKSIHAMEWLSQAYAHQGLYFAAKYYALASAYVVLKSDKLSLKWHISSCLERASNFDYALGAWVGFYRLAEAASIFYPHFVRDSEAEYYDPEGVPQQLTFHLGMALAITKRLEPHLEESAKAVSAPIAERVGIGNRLESASDEADRFLRSYDTKGVWKLLEEQMPGRPWSDTRQRREIEWRSHGIHWKATWANDGKTTQEAEAFLSALQIVLSDLADVDLCLLRSKVVITVSGDANKSNSNSPRPDMEEDGTLSNWIDAEFEPSNAECRVAISLNTELAESARSLNHLLAGLLYVVKTVLQAVSLLPVAEFDAIIEKRIDDGLTHKIAIGASYGTCLGCFSDGSDITFPVQTWTPIDRPYNTSLCESIPWIEGLGPNYTREDSNDAILRRYTNFSNCVAVTLPSLRREPDFQAVVSELRKSNWKDWHILAAVAHVYLAYHLNRPSMKSVSRNDIRAFSIKLMNSTELPTSSLVPLDVFTEERMRFAFQMFIPAFISGWGLKSHQKTPDLKAIEDFAAKRYNFWTDDIEHDDPFRI